MLVGVLRVVFVFLFAQIRVRNVSDQECVLFKMRLRTHVHILTDFVVLR